MTSEKPKDIDYPTTTIKPVSELDYGLLFTILLPVANSAAVASRLVFC